MRYPVRALRRMYGALVILSMPPVKHDVVIAGTNQGFS